MSGIGDGPHVIDDEDVNRLRIALSRTVRELDRRSNEEGMTRTQLNVLASVACRERVAMADLAGAERLNPTMLSRIVGKLEDARLVTRVADETDRRAVWVEITRQGHELWKRNRAVRSALLADLLEEMPAPYASALLAAIPALEELAEATRRPVGHDGKS